MHLNYPKRNNYPVTILHVVEPFASGVAVFVKLLTEAMPSDLHIVIHGERKNVKAAWEVKREFPGANVRFIRWRSARRSIDPLKDMMALSELTTIFKRLKRKDLVDVVHLHSSKGGLLGRAAARIAGIDNVFYTPNGASFLSSQNRLVRYVFGRIEKFASRLGGQVVCCSPSEQLAYQRLGIESQYINNGISAAQLKTDPGLRVENQFTVVTSGRIDDQKNPQAFNEIATFFRDMPNWKFVWIGDGRLRHLLNSPNIEVTGWLDSAAAHSLVAGSQVYLSSSRYEGLSFAVLEALAMRKPVLLSHCTGNVDLVRLGANGDLYNSPYEAIVKLLQYSNNPEMLQVMGEYSGAICAADFDMQKNFEVYRELYSGKFQEEVSSVFSWISSTAVEKVKSSAI